MSVNLKRPQPRDQTNIQCYLQNSEYCRHNLAVGPTAKGSPIGLFKMKLQVRRKYVYLRNKWPYRAWLNNRRTALSINSKTK